MYTKLHLYKCTSVYRAHLYMYTSFNKRYINFPTTAINGLFIHLILSRAFGTIWYNCTIVCQGRIRAVIEDIRRRSSQPCWASTAKSKSKYPALTKYIYAMVADEVVDKVRHDTAHVAAYKRFLVPHLAKVKAVQK